MPLYDGTVRVAKGSQEPCTLHLTAAGHTEVDAITELVDCMPPGLRVLGWDLQEVTDGPGAADWPADYPGQWSFHDEHGQGFAVAANAEEMRSKLEALGPDRPRAMMIRRNPPPTLT